MNGQDGRSYFEPFGSRGASNLRHILETTLDGLGMADGDESADGHERVR